MTEVQTFVVGDIYTNCYLLKDVVSKKLAVVDPGDRSEQLVKAIDNEGGKLEYILLTHGHFDHIGFIGELCRLYSPKVCVGELEKQLISDPMLNLSALHNMKIQPFTVDKYLTDGETIYLGNTSIKFISTPGHTGGSGCYVTEDLIFSGDTVFCESVGRTDFPTSDPIKMQGSIKKIADFSGDYKIFPGHDCATTLSHERKYNPYMR